MTKRPGLLSILTLESVRDLFRHRSFLVLIFLVLAADRLLHHFVSPESLKHLLSLERWQEQLPHLVFVQFPELIGTWLFNPWTLAVLAGLFLFKQVVSLWPSSSLRGWHKQTGEGRLLQSLTSLKWSQFAWDLLALTCLSVFLACWGILHFSWCRIWWDLTDNAAAAWTFLALMGLAWPLVLAGLSYSSKLAVLQGGSFRERFGLFFKLFYQPQILFGSWLFYSCRLVLEILFVAVIPLGALLYLDNLVLRTLIASVSMTPSYSYLKMASFKFFLYLYSRYPLIQDEFRDYLTGS
jgi:hypothetical protein